MNYNVEFVSPVAKLCWSACSFAHLTKLSGLNLCVRAVHDASKGRLGKIKPVVGQSRSPAPWCADALTVRYCTRVTFVSRRCEPCCSALSLSLQARLEWPTLIGSLLGETGARCLPVSDWLDRVLDQVNVSRTCIENRTLSHIFLFLWHRTYVPSTFHVLELVPTPCSICSYVE